MPRTTKEKAEEKIIKAKPKAVKKTASKKPQQDIVTTKTTKKKTSTTSSVKKDTAKKTPSKSIVSAKKVAVKKETKKKVSSKKMTSMTEYYDLPCRYNQTIIKILAQTPDTLFVYWDISDEDKLALEQTYGANFFSTTTPILVVHNESMHYEFEVEINDFANSWYLHVEDPNCNYTIALGRKPKQYLASPIVDPIYLSSSNVLETPNDRILFERFQPQVAYKNVQSQVSTIKDFNALAYSKNMENIYHICDLYKTIYQDELLEEIVNNPSSHSSFTLK